MKLSEVLKTFGPEYLSRFKDRILPSHVKAVQSVLKCRTEALGGQIYSCPECHDDHYAYHSCNNRHCPACGGDKIQKWVKKQCDNLLPVPYFFVTFTVPEELRLFFRSHQKLFYSLIFKASSRALKDLAMNKRFIGGEIGFFGVLQTWARNLFYHPHVHYIVPGVALSPNHKKWIKIKNKKFLVHVHPLSARFKSLFRQELENTELNSQIPESVWRKDWVVHCEQAGYGKEIIQYVAPYVYKVAMSDSQNIKVNNGEITFQYEESKIKEKQKCTLPIFEFIRRYLQHVLPNGFVKVRYFGLMGANQKTLFHHLKLLIYESLSIKEQAKFLLINFEIRKKQMKCRKCKSVLIVTGILKPIRGP